MINYRLRIILTLIFSLTFLFSCKKDKKPEVIEKNCHDSLLNEIIDYSKGYAYESTVIPSYCRLDKIEILEKCKTLLFMSVDDQSTGSQYAVLRKLIANEKFDTIDVFNLSIPYTPKDSIFKFIDAHVNNEKYIYSYKFLEIDNPKGIVCESNSMDSR